MNRNFTLLLAAFFALFIISCQKEIQSESGIPAGNAGSTPGTPNGSTGSASDLLGTWKFVSLQVKSKTTNLTNAGGAVMKAQSEAEYTTTNNGGTITFDATTMSTKNLTYTVNATVLTTMYENGVLLNSLSLPLQSILPPSNSTGQYTRISADSLYFPSGAIFSGGVNGASEPSGAKISFVQKKLLLTQSIVQSLPSQGQGTSTVEAKMIATLEK
jgi:hypothetical protein